MIKYKSDRVEIEFEKVLSPKTRAVVFMLSAYREYKYNKEFVITCIERYDIEQEELIKEGKSKENPSLHQKKASMYGVVRACDGRCNDWELNEIKDCRDYVNSVFSYGINIKTIFVHSYDLSLDELIEKWDRLSEKQQEKYRANLHFHIQTSDSLEWD